MLASMGYEPDRVVGRPLIGICNTWSEFNPCHIGLRGLAEAAKRGVWQAGGFPLEFPTMSLHELFFTRTTMLYRNLVAMETEELLRSLPMDGVVLLSGCDKTVPAQIMAAASANIPAVLVPAGPTLAGSHKGRAVHAGTDATRVWQASEAGHVSADEVREFEQGLVPSCGTCAVLGTATTMACLTEAMGLALPGAGTIPAVDAARLRLAEASGHRVVGMIAEAINPAGLLTSDALDNAVRVLMAMGGSTNAVIHLAAIARRLRLPLSPSTFERASREVPFLCAVAPNGDYGVHEFGRVGGVSALMKEIAPLLHLDARRISGQTLAEELTGAPSADGEVIARLDHPLDSRGGLAMLKGSLAPDGAVIKRSAASTELLNHRGRAVVFEGVDQYLEHMRTGDVPIGQEDVLVLRNQGPIGAPGMPEVGQEMLIPPALVRRGVKDMVRITDGRMSGTGFGTVVLHVSPEAVLGSPLGLLQSGDEIRLDADLGQLDVLVPKEEFDRRRREWRTPDATANSGYELLYRQHVTQAPQGCDFDFLQSLE